MTQHSFFVICTVYMLVVVSPGPAFIFMTKVGLQEGKAVAFFSVIGYACGATTNAALAAFVAATLVERHARIGLIVSLFGSAFLVYLAADSFRQAQNKRRAQQEESRRSKEDRKARTPKVRTLKVRTPGAGFRSGLAASLSNPKGIAFFIAVFAPMVAGLPLLSKGLLLLFGFCLKFFWYGSVVFFFKQARTQRFYLRHAAAYDNLLGFVLVGMGLLILLEAKHYWGILS